MATANLLPNNKNGRALPLLALPVIGAGKAGGAHQAGEIVRALLPELYSFVRGHAVDVALVMREPAQYAAAQAARSALAGEGAWPELDERQRGVADDLAWKPGSAAARRTACSSHGLQPWRPARPRHSSGRAPGLRGLAPSAMRPRTAPVMVGVDGLPDREGGGPAA
jgi:hypothetical protein